MVDLNNAIKFVQRRFEEAAEPLLKVAGLKKEEQEAEEAREVLVYRNVNILRHPHI